MRIDIPLSGLNTASRRLDLRANNVANVNTPGYRALEATPIEQAGGGAVLGAVQRSEAPVPPEGSNVDLAAEQVGTLLDLRTAQSNINVLRAEDALLRESLDLLG